MIKIKFKQWDCLPVAGYYGNGSKALQLIDPEDGDPIATATVNLNNKLDDNLLTVKDYSENEGMADALIHAGIIHPEIVHTEKTGWVSISSYALTDVGLKLWELKAEQ